MQVSLGKVRRFLRLIPIVIVVAQIPGVASARASAAQKAHGPRLEISPAVVTDDDVLTLEGGKVRVVVNETRPLLAYATTALDEPRARAAPALATTGDDDEPILDARKVADISQW